MYDYKVDWRHKNLLRSKNVRTFYTNRDSKVQGKNITTINRENIKGVNCKDKTNMEW